MTTEKKARRLGDELMIRTNPEYDHEVDPSENEFQFWNPVSATNDLIKLANAALEVGQAVSDSMKRRTAAAVKRRELELQLEDLERELLVKEPPSASEAKSLKLISAAVERRATEAGRLEELQKIRAQIDVYIKAESIEQHKIDSGMMWLKVNERVSDNLKSALSFYKDERRREYHT